MGVMKLGRTLALREGVVGSRAGDDFPSAEMRRRLFKGDGIVSWTIGLSFDGEGRAKSRDASVALLLARCWDEIRLFTSNSDWDQVMAGIAEVSQFRRQIGPLN